jgi:hypothetical protein
MLINGSEASKGPRPPRRKCGGRRHELRQPITRAHFSTCRMGITINGQRENRRPESRAPKSGSVGQSRESGREALLLKRCLMSACLSSRCASPSRSPIVEPVATGSDPYGEGLGTVCSVPRLVCAQTSRPTGPESAPRPLLCCCTVALLQAGRGWLDAAWSTKEKPGCGPGSR